MLKNKIYFRKKGQITDSIIGVIIAVAVVFVLIVLLFKLFAPVYDENDEIAKSYFERLEVELKSVDNGGFGEFFMLDRGADKDAEFYLIYFGSKPEFENADKVHFSSSVAGKNILCICYKKSENTVCRHCSNFDFPASFEGKSIDGFIVGEGIRFDISKAGGSYNFDAK